MAVPNPFQKLKHGVLLCKSNFKTFVETFNFLVDFSKNISGDGDNGCDGLIRIDRTIQDSPVIRSCISMSVIRHILKRNTDVGRFTIANDESQSGAGENLKIINCYYRIGGRTYKIDDTPISATAGHVLALSVLLTGSTPQAEIKDFASMSAMNAAESETDHYISPLYKFGEEGIVECDFRIGPDAAAWEFAE